MPNYIPFVRGDSYYASNAWLPLVRGNGFTTQDGGEEVDPDPVVIGPGKIISFNAYKSSPMLSLVCSISPVQSGSGDPSPDNVRPITGHDGVTVYDDPAYGGFINWNQLALRVGSTTITKNPTATEDAENNSISFTGNVPSQKYIYAMYYGVYGTAGHVYYYGCKCTYSDNIPTIVWAKANNNDTAENTSNLISIGGGYYGGIGKSLAVTAGRLIFGASYSASGSPANTTIADMMFLDLTVMFGADKAEEILAMGQEAGVAYIRSLFPKTFYEPNTGTKTLVSAVNGDPYTEVEVTFPADPGTVYGGTLDMVSGVLTVDKGIVDLGDLEWAYNTSYAYPFFITVDSVDNAVKTVNVLTTMCESYKSIANRNSSNFRANNYDKQICFSASQSGQHLVCQDSAITDATTFTNSVKGVHLVFALAEPLVYQLTPQAVNTLVGQNNVWQESADNVTVEVKYVNDPN